MEQLKQIDPDQWESVPPLVELYENLPTTLRCSPVKNSTLFRKRSKSPSSGHTYPYIGYNPPNNTRFIVLDLDYECSILAYYDEGVPPPQFIVKNPKNGHSHYIYQLKDPVSFQENSRSHPIKFLRAIEQALTRTLKADQGFTGHLAKNALNSAHEVYITGAKPYSLNDLAKHLVLGNVNQYKHTQSANDHTYGRNCATFDAVRYQAYKFATGLSYTQIYNECLSLAEQHNARYDTPMSYNEIKGIAKSIAGYCVSPRYAKRFSNEEFIQRQKERGALGGKKSKRTPIPSSEKSQRPWEALGISKSTYYRDKKRK